MASLLSTSKVSTREPGHPATPSNQLKHGSQQVPTLNLEGWSSRKSWEKKQGRKNTPASADNQTRRRDFNFEWLIKWVKSPCRLHLYLGGVTPRLSRVGGGELQAMLTRLVGRLDLVGEEFRFEKKTDKRTAGQPLGFSLPTKPRHCGEPATAEPTKKPRLGLEKKTSTLIIKID